MLPAQKLKLLRELLDGLSREETVWLSGYTAALVASDESAEAAAPSAFAEKITITYGTESGNAKKLATALATKAKKQGIQSKLLGLHQYKLADLPNEKFFFTIISTQGEGEPPATARKFYEHLHKHNEKLVDLKFGVLALGDTAYPLFCKAGEDVDTQLERLGATRIAPLQKLDTDFEGEAESWFADLLQSLSGGLPSAPKAAAAPVAKKGKQLYTGTVAANINLNGRGSGKQTHHIEIESEDVSYQPGDALGVVPVNDRILVQKVLAVAGANGATALTYKETQHTLADALQSKLCIAHLPERVVQKYAAVTGHDIPHTRMDLLDLLRIYPVADAQQFVSVAEALEPIAPRLYSISSSPAAHTGQVHLTVARDVFEVDGNGRNGLCSDYLCGLKEGSSLQFYVHPNNVFKLPPHDKDVLMIGPGTGVAPFRSFVAERDAAGASGRSWLFFGDQRFTTDFLYQTEWQDWLSTGALTKMNVAFSRDGGQKVYVQHKLVQHAAAVFEWINGGAYVYVCGAKEPMSVDVERTFVRIIRERKSIGEEAALEYLQTLKDEGRYLTDVY